MLAGIPATAPATAATAAADASSRPTARTTTCRHTASRSRHGSSSLAAYGSGGSTTRLTTSGVTRTGGTPGSSPATSPAITSKEGAGTRSLPQSRDHRAQHHQDQDGLHTAHAADLAPAADQIGADQTSRRANYQAICLWRIVCLEV